MFAVAECKRFHAARTQSSHGTSRLRPSPWPSSPSQQWAGGDSGLHQAHSHRKLLTPCRHHGASSRSNRSNISMDASSLLSILSAPAMLSGRASRTLLRNAPKRRKVCARLFVFNAEQGAKEPEMGGHLSNTDEWSLTTPGREDRGDLAGDLARGKEPTVLMRVSRASNKRIGRNHAFGKAIKPHQRWNYQAHLCCQRTIPTGYPLNEGYLDTNWTFAFHPAASIDRASIPCWFHQQQA